MYPRLVWLYWIPVAALAGAIGLISGIYIALGLFILFLPFIFSTAIVLAPLIILLTVGGPCVVGGMLGGGIGGAIQWLLGTRFHDTLLQALRSYALVGGIAALPLLPLVGPLLHNQYVIMYSQLALIGAICGVGRAYILKKTAHEDASSRAEMHTDT
jgi:hypothetical protein